VSEVLPAGSTTFSCRLSGVDPYVSNIAVVNETLLFETGGQLKAYPLHGVKAGKGWNTAQGNFGRGRRADP
jgi:hypothetical protein